MLRQSLQQKQLQRLSPQQIQLMKLLQVPTIELEARIKQELEANPALEEGLDKGEKDDLLDDHDHEEREDSLEEFDFDEYLDDETPDYKTSIRNHGADVEDKDIPLGAGETFREKLINQLGLQQLEEYDRMLGEYLIGQIDDAGYLRRDLQSIVNDLAFTQNLMVEKEDLEKVLRVIQTLDPAGVGATSLQECLQIQIDRKLSTISDRVRQASLTLAGTILEKHYDAFTKKHYSQIISKLEIDEDILKIALDEIIPPDEITDTKASATRRLAEVSACGEHAAEPKSIEFFVRNAVDGVSCSAFRVLGARLAVAKAQIQVEDEQEQDV